MMPKGGVATAQKCTTLFANLWCLYLAALRGPWCRAREDWKVPAGPQGAMPRSKFIEVKIHSGLGEGVGHTSPFYMVDKVRPRLPVWKGRPKRARRVV